MLRYNWRTGILEVVMVAFGLAFMFPIYILIVTAFKATNDFSSALSLPLKPTFANFTAAWTEARIGSAFINSLVVTSVSVVVLVLTCSMAAYPLARITARWSKVTYYAFILGLILPFQLALLPLYETMKTFGLVGSLYSLIFLYAGIQAPFSIFLYTEFLRSVPRDYEDAASIDGCGRWKVYWSILMPLLRPITGTVVVLNAVFIWNDFYAPLLYLSGSGHATLPVAEYQFTGQYGSDWNLVFAALLLGAIPIVVTFLVMQKATFRGYMSGLK
jgi:raffinose/stachyose/melibiose transport system permease protein